MELEFSADQDELRDAIRTMLVKESPVSLARGVFEHGTRPDALWATVVALGWPALTVPEEFGGIGLGMLETAILAEELGRVIAPGPLLATVAQFVPIVRECGTGDQQAHWLGAVARGQMAATVAMAEGGGGFDPDAVTTAIVVDGDSARVDGVKRYVVEGDTVDEVAVVGREGDQLRVAIVPAGAAQVTPVNALDGSRRLVHLTFDGVHVAIDRVLPTDARAVRRALEEATVALALEMVGTAQTIFDITLEYAKNRQQFGVPIGSFQAIKHKFADMLIALERARSLGYFAALTIAEDDDRRTAATSVAKAAAGDCQRLLAKEGIQIHGGIGYTWEHDMHLYVKRMKSGEPLFGTSAWHRARIAESLGL